MAKLPAMPLWIDAYVADTLHLTAEQDGYYIRLLMLLWRSPGQRIPNDDAWIGPRLRAASEVMAAIVRPLIKEFCQSDGNWITQDRITREHNYVTKLSKRQSDIAKSRWNKEKDLCHGNAQSGNAPIPTPIKKESKKDALPDGSPPTAASSPEKELYQRGRAVLGKEAGGLIKKLLAAKGGNAALARAVIEMASTKADPREYVGGVLRNSGAAPGAALSLNELWGEVRV